MPDKLISVLRDAQHVVISTHTRPDGDAIGSQLGLGLFLQGKGKHVTLLNSDPTPYNMEWLPGSDQIQIFDKSLAQLEAVHRADAIVVVDTNGEKRLGEVGSSIRSAGGKKLLVDHHTDPEEWFDEVWTRESASSAGQLVYEIISRWNELYEDGRLDSTEISTALYVAILTDTGSFRFSHVTPDLHRIVAELIEAGNLNVTEIYAEVYEIRSVESIRLLSNVLSTLELHHNGQVGVVSISRGMLQETGASIAEADGFVNHVLTIEGVRVAIIFTETARGTKASFRSKENFEVHKWAASFGGGGHRCAAGAFVKDKLAPAMTRVMKAAPKYLPLLDTSENTEADKLDLEDAAYLASLTTMHNKK